MVEVKLRPSAALSLQMLNRVLVGVFVLGVVVISLLHRSRASFASDFGSVICEVWLVKPRTKGPDIAQFSCPGPLVGTVEESISPATVRNVGDQVRIYFANKDIGVYQTEKPTQRWVTTQLTKNTVQLLTCLLFLVVLYYWNQHRSGFELKKLSGATVVEAEVIKVERKKFGFSEYTVTYSNNEKKSKTWIECRTIPGLDVGSTPLLVITERHTGFTSSFPNFEFTIANRETTP